MSLHLFEAFGIELEYMIVGRDGLGVMPVADRLLVDEQGQPQLQLERGDISWSNELALHVIEMKTSAPAPTLAGLAARFHANALDIDRRLAPLGARLMPTAMHPWMHPDTELALWPHENDVIYRTFDRIFDCRGHGWANLQSMHINLPFQGDDEFARLHAAIRLILPILPALAASSPVVEGTVSGPLDRRMQFYATNARRVPSVTGAVVPESARTIAEYKRDILERIYRDLAPHDPEGTLRNEWVNARGAISRFDRNAIEIRVLDIQECPASDLAIAAAVVSTVRALVLEQICNYERQYEFPLDPLVAIFQRTVEQGDIAVIGDSDSELAYLRLLGVTQRCTAGELWSRLIDGFLAKEPNAAEWLPALRHILQHGCLARRIVRALAGSPSSSGQSAGQGAGMSVPREALAEVYGELCRCLLDNRLFVA